MARRIPEYDYSRTIAIAAVVAIHVLAGALAQSSRVEVPAWVRPTDQFLLRLAVPLFAFISGALVWTGKEFGSVAEYGSFLKRRALVVLVPYVLWTGFYYLYVVLETPQTFDLRTLIWHVLVGTATYHLYYVPVIVLGYILAPAARFLYARMPVGLLAGGVAVAMLGPSVLSRTPGMLGNFTSLAANVVLLMPYVACGAWFASLPRGKTGRWVDAGGLAAALVVYGSARWIAAQRLPMPPPASRAIGFADRGLAAGRRRAARPPGSLAVSSARHRCRDTRGGLVRHVPCAPVVPAVASPRARLGGRAAVGLRVLGDHRGNVGCRVRCDLRCGEGAAALAHPRVDRRTRHPKAGRARGSRRAGCQLGIGMRDDDPSGGPYVMLHGMESIIVRGGRALSGEVRVEGAKNSALKLMAASILASGLTRISNVPDIADVAVMVEVLVGLGASVSREDHSLAIDTTNVASVETPYELVARMRASTAVLGPLVARCGEARVAMPGGCNIGSRKIDMHIKGLEQLGVEINLGHGFIHAVAPPGGLHGADVALEFPSVGATENLLTASVLAKGTTTVQNAAREPEIVDLAEFLIAMGANIQGAGTSTLVIEGVETLHPVDHRTVGDRIEAGTFLIGAALDSGPVTVSGFDARHLDLVLAKLREAGCVVDMHPDGVTVRREGPLRGVDVQTLPYPGFPTDLQAQWMALMSIAEGGSIITENVFENRFMFADELGRMGADIRIEGHHALVKGVGQLSGAPVRAPDLRGGAALVLAGLVADGETVVSDVHHIDRGYERFVAKLTALGADVRRES